jgi:hypothetical protein
MTGKIFGVGLSRTGTSTLVNALGILGFSAVHFPHRDSDIVNNDAAADTPIAANFVQLDRMFPNSKFIYTTRNIEDWLSSCARFWAKRQAIFDSEKPITDLHQRLYKTTTFDRELFTAAYRRHDAFVRKYFADRPDDWIEFDICEGGGDWPVLCKFLGTDIPTIPFPWSNRGDAIDQMLVRALHVLDDVKLLSRIASVSQIHLENLKKSELFLNHDAALLMDYDDGAEASFLALRLCQSVGSLQAASKTFGFSLEKLQSSKKFIDSRR